MSKYIQGSTMAEIEAEKASDSEFLEPEFIKAEDDLLSPFRDLAELLDSDIESDSIPEDMN